MSGEYGIEETKDVITLGASFGMAVYRAGKDGWQWTDYLHLLPVLPHIGPALEGIEKVPAEIADIDDEERAELFDWAKEKFQIGEEDVDEFVDNCLEIGKLVWRNVEIGKTWW